MTNTSPTKTDFRKALGQFATGVTIITVERAPGQVHAMTANAVTSISLEPLLVLISVDQRARTLPLLHEKKRFGITVLAEDQQEISGHFAQSDLNHENAERLGVRFTWTETGIPLLEGGLAHLACNVVASHVAGDHSIFIGEVESLVVRPGRPLLFFAGKYSRLAPEGL